MACVLVVEDNDDLRALYQDVMDLEGYSVLTAANGQEALSVLRAAAEPPKLIILDLMMPVMDGWQFLDRVRGDEALRGIKVVVCSAAKDLIPEGVPVLRKPVDLDDLTQAVAKYCGS